jgi:actin-like ATPase involved in cell morphogenesis
MASDKTVAVLTAISTGIHALEAIGDTAAAMLGAGPVTTDAIHAFLSGVVAVVDGFRKGVSGSIDPSSVAAELEKLKASVASSDAAIDASLDAKFPPGAP